MNKEIIINKKNIIKDKNYVFYSLESEISVIGGLMIDNNKIQDVLDIIDSNDFFLDTNKIIFDEIKLLFELHIPVDLITLSDSLNKKNKLKLIGGKNYLLDIISNISGISNILYYSQIIKEKSLIRNIIYLSNDIYNICINPNGKSIYEILDFIELKLFKAIENKIYNNLFPKNIDYFLDKTFNAIKKNCYNKNYLTGISSGYYDIDKKTLGFQNSDLIIIAARPSMGKTTLAINICENISLSYKKPILIFSLEMSGEQILIKILSSLSKIDQYKIRTGNLSESDYENIKNIYTILLKNKNIYIDDTSYLTTYDLRSKSRRVFKENNGLSLIMIDYLQLIRVPNSSNNRTSEITEISRSLKSLAKELNIPIIAISQLNRSLELRINKRPINSDLRESGSIEQDADLIMFIYRDEIYNKNLNNESIAEIIISKHRNGPLGIIKLLFNDKISRFDNYIEFNLN